MRQAECRAFAEENGIGLGRGGPQGEGMSGPGGCKSPEECRAYCDSHPEECGDFRPGQGPDRPVGQERAIERRGFEVPPGLMEECKENPEACRARFENAGLPGGDPKTFMNMSEEERQKFMQEGERGRMNEFKGRPNTKPYQPEGMMPPEAFRRPPQGGEMRGDSNNKNSSNSTNSSIQMSTGGNTGRNSNSSHNPPVPTYSRAGNLCRKVNSDRRREGFRLPTAL